MKEIFQDYYATPEGQIWSAKTQEFVAQRTNNRGYCIVNLSINGKCKTFTVHRLIATAFILNPNNYPVINHKDGNKLNNSINNLEWCTYSYNVKHALANNLTHRAKGKDTNNGRFSESDIIRIKELKKQGMSQYKIAALFNVTRGTIQQIINGSTYKWMKNR